MSITLATPTPDDVFVLSKIGELSVELIDNTDITKPAVLSFKRTEPKPTATFAGVNRHEIKVSQRVALADSSVVTAIATISSSFPVGMTDAQMQLFLDRIKDLSTSTAADNLLTKNLLPLAGS
ncbi:coat protein [ssRNA phage Gephyllon.4_17]|uniref:Coat protein n=2 Tax=Norzivirales TaxID=2842247 RepID=A0A8S5KYL3_9VIRU|nr:coat protein [ssRNA phage Gephyllon.4_17]QDH88361.1 MAG: hypothetical protein H4BulkLitter24234_000002 [Leviviridae sp.]DAD50268.1 TPA_asm: coat protein [ssRNA phage Gephyllon.4_17]